MDMPSACRELHALRQPMLHMESFKSKHKNAAAQTAARNMQHGLSQHHRPEGSTEARVERSEQTCAACAARPCVLLSGTPACLASVAWPYRQAKASLALPMFTRMPTRLDFVDGDAFYGRGPLCSVDNAGRRRRALPLVRDLVLLDPAEDGRAHWRTCQHTTVSKPEVADVLLADPPGQPPVQEVDEEITGVVRLHHDPRPAREDVDVCALAHVQ